MAPYVCHGCGAQLPDSGRIKSYCRDCAPSIWTEQVDGGNIFMLRRFRNMAEITTFGGKKTKTKIVMTPDKLFLVETADGPR